jgi:two-component system response regulator FlrC
MSAFRVLLVEDDDALREALAETLELEDIDVLVAADGRSALEIAGRESLSLVVSDIQMPGWDGLELLRRLRRRHAELPVMLMTAFGSVPQAVSAVRAGAVDYLVKPVEADQLIERVKRFRDRPGEDADLVAAARRLMPDSFTAIPRAGTAPSWQSTARPSRSR